MQSMRKALRWLMGALTLAICLSLAWTCVSMYVGRGSQKPFQMAEVTERLRAMLPLFLVWVLLLFVCLIAGAGGETDRRGQIGAPDMYLMQRKQSALALPESAQAEEGRRRRSTRITQLLLAILFLPFLLWMMGDEALSLDFERTMGRLMLYLSPVAMLALMVLMVHERKRQESIRKECEILRSGSKKGTRQQAARTDHTSVIRLILALLGILFTVLGVMNGGMRDVMVKAIQICTECIGLG
ncbi:MAG: hypothetical protein IJ083_14270 [Clostridia bacterium]|nr:hypothetical protein [Clostridia bacterium]